MGRMGLYCSVAAVHVSAAPARDSRASSTRAGHEPVVIVSLDDYESLKETAYLLKSPANARRLLGSIDRLEASQGMQHDIHE